jgi:hypothetical protein
MSFIEKARQMKADGRIISDINIPPFDRPHLILSAFAGAGVSVSSHAHDDLAKLDTEKLTFLHNRINSIHMQDFMEQSLMVRKEIRGNGMLQMVRNRDQLTRNILTALRRRSGPEALDEVMRSHTINS